MNIKTFQEQMLEAGLQCEVIPDAIIHRFPVWGDRSGETSGSYWHNGSIGWFQDWRTMEKPKLVHDKLSEADKRAIEGSFTAPNNKVSRQALIEGVRRLWKIGTIPDGHSYLKAKGITAPPQVKELDGALLIPLMSPGNEIKGMQKITADGKKRFLTGTRKKGALFGIKGSGTHLICEGFATGVSLHEATGASVCVAFDAGNLKAVAIEVAKKIDTSEICITGDNDLENPKKNKGAKMAEQAARAIGCRYVLPKFKQYNGKVTTDFNDLARVEGLEVVKKQVKGAKRLLRTYHCTDLGLSERLVDLHGNDFRYCYKFRRFFVWDGVRWNGDDAGILRRFCKDTVKSIFKEAATLDDSKARKELVEYALRCETVKKSRDMAEFAQSEKGIPIQPEELDKDIFLFNCLSGTIDLKTGLLRQHNRNDLITKLAPANYNPDAKCPECPKWNEHVDKIMAGKKDLIEFLQKAYGYSLTGDTSERKIIFQYGKGANGKSVTNDMAANIMGDYAMRTPTETLLVKRGEGIPCDIARLKGARFVYASEAEQGRRLAESQIKDMTGGDKITARFLHQEWFEFYPEFKIWLGTNHKPIIKGTDQAIWDRIILIPFNVRISESEKIPKSELFEIFNEERDGILAWMVRGCLQWQKEGLGMPKEVSNATNTYRRDMDIISQFIEERCVLGDSCTVSAKELYQEYEKWTNENGEEKLTKKMFGVNLNERNIDSYKGNRNKTMRVGIGLQS